MAPLQSSFTRDGRIGLMGTREGKLGEPGEKPRGARRGNQQQTLPTHNMTPGEGIEPRLSSSPLRQPQILLQIQDKIVIINKVIANCGSFTFANLLDLDRVPFLPLSVLYK